MRHVILHKDMMEAKQADASTLPLNLYLYEDPRCLAICDSGGFFLCEINGATDTVKVFTERCKKINLTVKLDDAI